MEDMGSVSEMGVEVYLQRHLSRWDSNRSHSEYSIYTVPDGLRRVKEEAYTPRLVSIGPLHRSTKHLQAMEATKLRYVSHFLSRSTNPSLHFYVQLAKEWEEAARECYQNIIKLSSDEFVYMILVDGIFLVELLMRNYFADDDIFLKLWMRADIFHDIMLLENQLPFFILERLYHTIEISVVGKEKPPFYDLAYNYFNYAVNLRTCSESQLIDEGSKIKHMVDLVYSFYWPPENLIAWGLYLEDVKEFEFTRTAAELHAAGVKFKVKEDCGYPVAIEFAYGFLNIPRLTVNEWTEPLLRNLIAYEQCHQYDRMVSSYVMLMKSLINRPKDVDVLIDCGIIDNSLGSSEDVCILINSLHNFKAAMNGRQFYYRKLCKDLNAYSRTRWNQWKAKWYRSKQILKRDYLSNPWTTLSVIAAVLLLGLSVIQAVCSILALQ